MGPVFVKKKIVCKLWIDLPFKLLGIMDHDDRFWYICSILVSFIWHND